MGKLKIAIYYGDKRNTGEYDNGIWMHILGIPYIQKVEEAERYDVIIRTLWLEATGWSKEIRDRFPHVKQIGLSDHPLSTHVSKMQPKHQLAYLQDLQYLDGLMALTEEERQWYQTALPAIPVIKAGLPFPIDTYTERYSTFVDSEKKFVGLGVGASDNDRNFVSSFIVYRRLKLEFPDIQGVFLSIPSNQITKDVYPFVEAGSDIYIHERVDMGAFYDILSQCRFVINLADRNTPGRLQGEAAFFGVPVIGTNRLELQNELFPDLAVSPYSLEDAVNLGRRLLKDEINLEPILKKARAGLETYNYARSKRRFNKILKEVLERG